MFKSGKGERGGKGKRARKRSTPQHIGHAPVYRGESGPDELLAVFNNGNGAASLTLPSGNWTDVANGGTVQGTLSVPGLGWRYPERN